MVSCGPIEVMDPEHSFAPLSTNALLCPAASDAGLSTASSSVWKSPATYVDAGRNVGHDFFPLACVLILMNAVPE
jgi:hypothetical protein